MTTLLIVYSYSIIKISLSVSTSRGKGNGRGSETAISLEAVRSTLPQEVLDIPANFHILKIMECKEQNYEFISQLLLKASQYSLHCVWTLKNKEPSQARVVHCL